MESSLQQAPCYNQELNELQIVLIGQTGVGKSSTGNTILGKDVFEASVAEGSVTKECQSDEANRFGKKILVVDTPGIYDTDMTIEENKAEVSKLVNMTVPGPHAIVLVVSAGRFTKEHQDAVGHFADMFVVDKYKYLIVLFTGRDNIERQSQSLKAFIEHSPKYLRDLLRMCSYQYIAFDNTKPKLQRDSDAKRLVDLIGEVVARNGGSHYTNEMYKKAVEVFRKREEDQMNAVEEKQRLHDDKIRREQKAKADKLQRELDAANRRRRKRRRHRLIRWYNNPLPMLM